MCAIEGLFRLIRPRTKWWQLPSRDASHVTVLQIRLSLSLLGLTMLDIQLDIQVVL